MTIPHSDGEMLAPSDAMHRIDVQLHHVWMVRTFLKHSPEAEDDEELREIHRELYDYMLALGAPFKTGDAAQYLKLANKKLSKLRKAAQTFAEIQPEVSSHTNFVMALGSLQAATEEIERLLGRVALDAT